MKTTAGMERRVRKVICHSMTERNVEREDTKKVVTYVAER